ncbi:NADP-dependent alcohol dehydrogenase 6 [Escovopsis weberi]|uniref:NADP-dependent alcohol dehydrogenase 6 n=1 Tax=Escovopsis weberi TaxID=150374 RepID=A0A0M8MRL5_ESCWE|nr:NADP-dependent alcohol dehydrogenase 6 [Escovopsis weberi]
MPRLAQLFKKKTEKEEPASAGYPDTFTGFCVDGPKTWTQFHKSVIKPKPFEGHDVDIAIEACGVCGSDVHSLTGGWGGFEGPLCVGHEIVGKVMRVGDHVSNVKEGDRVGVGAQIYACLECDLCKANNENYCESQVATYNDKYPDGSFAQGGFASHIRAHEHFTFKIPEALESKDAAPLLCAGITTYSPLARAKIGPGMDVGILGIGGLGHLGLQWARAMGANVYAFSHSPDKADDCKKLGAREVILTNKKDWSRQWKHKFDYVLNCSDVTDKLDIPDYLSVLKPGGDFHMVGIGDHNLPQMSIFTYTGLGVKMSGSHIGNRQEMEEMLQLAADKDIKPWVEELPLTEKGCKEAMERVHENKVHYRLTMTGYDKAFGR